MTGPRQWRIVHEPDDLAPWIVQVATPGGGAWLDYRRFHDEHDARRFVAVARPDEARGRAR